MKCTGRGQEVRSTDSELHYGWRGHFMIGIDLRNEKGAVAVLVGILMVVFILCIALVVDLGHLHNVKVQLQRAADAAALAGAGQLDGSTDQDTNASNVARAAAALNKVGNKTGLVAEGGWVDNASVTVALGTWNPDHTETTRFSSPADPNMANAIKVTATLLVDHYFFFFPSGSEVIADAIAVNDYEKNAMPIALLSCIPISEGFSNDVCDMKFYKFLDDTSDTAGWSALTFPTNADQLKYFFTRTGNVVLNQILYGTGQNHNGLENEPVIKGDNSYNPDIACGGRNVGLDIECGLGPDFESDPDPDDPLDYVQNANDPLPRWDNYTAFEKIWSMDGILKKGYVTGETDAQYEARLNALKAASTSDDWTTYVAAYPSPTFPDWAKDGRFVKLIGKEPGGPKTIAFYDQALHYAGYPAVDAKNGSNNAVMQEFIDLATESGHFRNGLVGINPPFDATASADPHNSYAGGDTYGVTVPVIFAGTCGDDGWKALKGKYYIGTANLLISRMWKNQNDCYDAEKPLTIYGSPPCSASSFSPKLVGDEFACVTGASSGAVAGFEALITPNLDEDQLGGKKVFLVE